MKNLPAQWFRSRWIVPCLTVVLSLCLDGFRAARAQEAQAKTSDIAFEVAADGSMKMAFQMTFDAGPWRSWKAMVGDEPARMRAMMRHEFAAMTLEDFKLERDDMNRVAKMSMHSASGPELREDGSLQIPVDGYFRLVSHAGREWYFSGNNSSAGGALNNVKVTLPTNVTTASVANPDNLDQALVFALVPPPSPSRWFYLAGGVVSLAGLGVLLTGILWRKRGTRNAVARASAGVARGGDGVSAGNPSPNCHRDAPASRAAVSAPADERTHRAPAFQPARRVRRTGLRNAPSEIGQSKLPAKVRL